LHARVGGATTIEIKDIEGQVGRTRKKGLQNNKTFLPLFFGTIINIGDYSFLLWATKFSK